ncbi:hypothetical protein [Winogradskyella tangerina]|uniref:hypothetical protein n=1 Tax=Winogradskyella tangerina TaxID=2023240 RepID=UPI000DBE6944|nr:hypothetical protein [Winogradskyella tangerina]
MRKVILTLLIFQFFCCSDNIKEYDLIGNWSSIKNDSIYFEVKVDSNYMLFYNYDYSFLPLRPYYLNGDSLFMKYSEHESNYIGFSISSEDNVIALKNSKNSTTMKFIKIDSSEFTFDEITNKDDELFKFEVKHLNRRNKLLGIDNNYNLDSINKVFKNLGLRETGK